jgi:glycosyltransferase involved in cell wall biosynthesis
VDQNQHRASDNPGAGRGRIGVIRFGPYSDDPSTTREVEALMQEGYEVTVLCTRAEHELWFEHVDGVDVHRVTGPGNAGFWNQVIAAKWFVARAGWRVLVQHMRRPFRFLQVDNPPDFLVFVTWIPRLFGVAVVLRLSVPEPEYWQDRMPAPYQRPLILLLRLVRRIGLHMVDHVIVDNREMREYLGSRGGDINRISVVSGVTDTTAVRMDEYESVIDEVSRLRRQERRKGTFRIVMRAPDGLDDGIRAVVHAIAHLQERLPGVECVMLESHGAAEDIEQVARDQRVNERISCPVNIGSDAAVRQILAADVCLVSRPRTPYTSLVSPPDIYHYVALGKPVVASRLGAIVSYFSEDSVIYFEPGDVDDLADKIYAVYAHPGDARARAANANDIYDTHRWEREHKKYVGVFRDLGT